MSVEGQQLIFWRNIMMFVFSMRRRHHELHYSDRFQGDSDLASLTLRFLSPCSETVPSGQ